MCMYPHGSRVFMIACVLILLSLAMRLTTVSLDMNLIKKILQVLKLVKSISG